MSWAEGFSGLIEPGRNGLVPIAFKSLWGLPSVYKEEVLAGGEVGLCNLHVVPPGNLAMPEPVQRRKLDPKECRLRS